MSTYPTRLALITTTVLLSLSADARTGSAQDPEFEWMDELPAGATVRVFTVAGDVTVEASPDGTARVRGRTRAEGFAFADASDLRFEMRRDGDDVLICALDREASCDAEGLHTRDHDDDRRVRADFTVELPAGIALRAGSGTGDVRVAGATAAVHTTSGNGEVYVGPGAERVTAASGNGDVEVGGARGPVEANSGNGDVVVSTARGPTNASTGNGSVKVRMASLPAEADMSFRSGNGRIVLLLPDGFSGEIDATTGNGGFSSDFPIRMEGPIGRGRFRGTIGQGGQTIRISTGNGSIELRRAGSIDGGRVGGPVGDDGSGQRSAGVPSHHSGIPPA